MTHPRNRFTITIFGVVCLLGASASLLAGNGHMAVIGFLFGAALILLNERWFWRSRN